MDAQEARRLFLSCSEGELCVGWHKLKEEVIEARIHGKDPAVDWPKLQQSLGWKELAYTVVTLEQFVKVAPRILPPGERPSSAQFETPSRHTAPSPQNPRTNLEPDINRANPKLYSKPTHAESETPAGRLKQSPIRNPSPTSLQSPRKHQHEEVEKVALTAAAQGHAAECSLRSTSKKVFVGESSKSRAGRAPLREQKQVFPTGVPPKAVKMPFDVRTKKLPSDFLTTSLKEADESFDIRAHRAWSPTKSKRGSLSPIRAQRSPPKDSYAAAFAQQQQESTTVKPEDSSNIVSPRLLSPIRQPRPHRSPSATQHPINRSPKKSLTYSQLANATPKKEESTERRRSGKPHSAPLRKTSREPSRESLANFKPVEATNLSFQSNADQQQPTMSNNLVRSPSCKREKQKQQGRSCTNEGSEGTSHDGSAHSAGPRKARASQPSGKAVPSPKRKVSKKGTSGKPGNADAAKLHDREVSADGRSEGCRGIDNQEKSKDGVPVPLSKKSSVCTASTSSRLTSPRHMPLARTASGGSVTSFAGRPPTPPRAPRVVKGLPPQQADAIPEVDRSIQALQDELSDIDAALTQKTLPSLHSATPSLAASTPPHRTKTEGPPHSPSNEPQNMCLLRTVHIYPALLNAEPATEVSSVMRVPPPSVLPEEAQDDDLLVLDPTQAEVGSSVDAPSIQASLSIAPTPGNRHSIPAGFSRQSSLFSEGAAFDADMFEHAPHSEDDTASQSSHLSLEGPPNTSPLRQNPVSASSIHAVHAAPYLSKQTSQHFLPITEHSHKPSYDEPCILLPGARSLRRAGRADSTVEDSPLRLSSSPVSPAGILDCYEDRFGSPWQKLPPRSESPLRLSPTNDVGASIMNDTIVNPESAYESTLLRVAGSRYDDGQRAGNMPSPREVEDPLVHPKSELASISSFHEPRASTVLTDTTNHCYPHSHGAGNGAFTSPPPTKRPLRTPANPDQEEPTMRLSGKTIAMLRSLAVQSYQDAPPGANMSSVSHWAPRAAPDAPGLLPRLFDGDLSGRGTGADFPVTPSAASYAFSLGSAVRNTGSLLSRLSPERPKLNRPRQWVVEVVEE
ncbi:hypothetical protein DIPPA_54092 [Diplonema papillatum]|nr:hypothetical protein DIPPA_54092 [Diplonema papillatum]